MLVAQPVHIFRAKLWKIVVKTWVFLKCTFLRLRHFISSSIYPINSIFFSGSIKNHVSDETFSLLAIVAMITEKMYFSYFYGNIYKRKIPSSNHAAHQSRLFLEKMESDKVY